MELLPDYSRWCALPFFHLSTTPKGEIRPCCKSHKVGKVGDEGFRETWNNKKMKDIRKSFMEGKNPASCQDCWQDEELGVVSFRQKIMPLIDESYCDFLKKNVSSDGTQVSPITYLELKLSNICNLMCRMCSPESSSKWESYLNKNSHQFSKSPKNIFEADGVKKEIIDIINNPVFETICFVGGEPFLDKNHFEIMESINDPARLSYIANTNFTNIFFQGKNILELLKSFKEVRLIISIDGDRLRHEYVRCGINLDLFEKNLLLLKENYQISKWKVYSSAAISLYNVYYIPELIEYSLKFDLIPNIFTFISSPEHQSISLLPYHAREKIREGVSRWIANFDLLRFVKMNNLNRLAKNFDEAQDNINKSVSSLLNALNTLPMNCDQNEFFFAETKELDVVYKQNLSAVNASLEEDLKNDQRQF